MNPLHCCACYIAGSSVGMYLHGVLPQYSGMYMHIVQLVRGTKAAFV